MSYPTTGPILHQSATVKVLGPGSILDDFPTGSLTGVSRSQIGELADELGALNPYHTRGRNHFLGLPREVIENIASFGLSRRQIGDLHSHAGFSNPYGPMAAAQVENLPARVLANIEREGGTDRGWGKLSVNRDLKTKRLTTLYSAQTRST